MGDLQKFVEAAFCCGKPFALFDKCGWGRSFADGAAMKAVVCKRRGLTVVSGAWLLREVDMF